MTIKIGINGFGRIGRLVFRAALGNPNVEVVAINDLSDTKTLAHMLKYDSTHGTLPETVEATETGVKVAGREVKVFSKKEPKELPWGDAGAQIVVESTGIFTKRDAAAAHLAGGAKKVIISAPANDSDITIVMGVNDDKYDPAKHHVMSNASCTTNCLAPVVKVLHEKFGIIHGLMNTIHSYTNDQRILDMVHKDLRRARAAALSMIPTSTGAAVAIGLVIPELKGKLDGFSIRVPTPNVSVVDFTAKLKTATDEKGVNAALKAAAEGSLRGILDYNELPLVSCDYNHCPASSTIDGLSTTVIDGDFVKVLSWYDNEWGYSNRVVDLAVKVGGKL